MRFLTKSWFTTSWSSYAYSLLKDVWNGSGDNTLCTTGSYYAVYIPVAEDDEGFRVKWAVLEEFIDSDTGNHTVKTFSDMRGEYLVKDKRAVRNAEDISLNLNMADTHSPTDTFICVSRMRDEIIPEEIRSEMCEL